MQVEQQQDTVVLDPPARRNGPGKTYEYKLYLDGENVALVGEWEAEHAETTMFCRVVDNSLAEQLEPTLQRHADCVDGDDLRWIGTVEAPSNDAAVEIVLSGKAFQNERAKVVRAAHEAHVSLTFTVLASGKITTVPKAWTQTWVLG